MSSMRARRLVSGPVTTVTLPGARHELAGCDDRVVEVVGDWLGRDGGVAQARGPRSAER